MNNWLENLSHGYEVYTDIRLERTSVKHKA